MNLTWNLSFYFIYMLKNNHILLNLTLTVPESALHHKEKSVFTVPLGRQDVTMHLKAIRDLLRRQLR